jgi:hypothetical protein
MSNGKTAVDNELVMVFMERLNANSAKCIALMVYFS